MTQLSLTIPTIGSSFATAAPNVNSDLTAIQNVINGNLDTGNFAAALQAVMVADAQTHVITVRPITGTSVSLSPGWQSLQYTFTAFPTACIMAFGVIGPVTNGSNLGSWNMNGFSNGNIVFELNPGGTDTFKVFGLAYGY